MNTKKSQSVQGVSHDAPRQTHRSRQKDKMGAIAVPVKQPVRKDQTGRTDSQGLVRPPPLTPSPPPQAQEE